MSAVAPFAPLLAQPAEPPPCGPPEETNWLCEVVLDVTGKDGLARAADVLVARPVAVALILITAFILNRLARRGIRRFVRRLQEEAPTAPGRLRFKEQRATPRVSPRRAQRAEAIGTLMRSTATVIIWSIAILMALSELGLNLAPLLTGAGVVGVALGFGSQALVRDFLSGIFMLVEDQFGVGDIVDVGEATGEVESISLRSTRLRGIDGTVWHVPNGEIHRVGNLSQEWSRALLDIPVAYGSDLDHASDVILRVAEEMAAEPTWAQHIIEPPPAVWGVESFDADSVSIRLVVTTRPMEKWKVSRELRRRLKAAFDAEGVEIPFPQRTVWMRQDGGVPPDEEGAGGGA